MRDEVWQAIKDEMLSSICRECWAQQKGATIAHVLTPELSREVEECCLCGKRNTDGIYVFNRKGELSRAE